MATYAKSMTRTTAQTSFTKPGSNPTTTTNQPIGGTMNTRSNRPEAFHARALHDYAEQLTIAVRMLEHTVGYWDGVTEAQVAA